MEEKEEKILPRVAEIDITEIMKNPKQSKKGLGDFFKNLGERIKGQKKSKEPPTAEKSQVIEKEEKIETEISEI